MISPHSYLPDNWTRTYALPVDNLLRKKDISGNTNVITLSGYQPSATPPTPLQINQSISLAVKLYWELTQINGTVRFKDYTGDIYESFAISRSKQPTIDSRVNVLTSYHTQNVAIGDWGFAYTNFDNLTDSPPVFLPVRFYNGSTGDDSNFIGYGLDHGFWGGMVTGDLGWLSSQVIIGSHAQEDTSPDDPFVDDSMPQYSGAPGEHSYDEAFINVGPFHFFCQAEAYSSNSGDSVSADASSLQEATVTSFDQGDDDVELVIKMPISNLFAF